MIAMPLVGFSSSPRFVEHDTGPHHPERPDRIRAIHRAVREAGLIDSPDPFPDFTIDLGLRAAIPSPGIPREGRGEGSASFLLDSLSAENPHPNPLPAYRERGSERGGKLIELSPTLADEKWLRLVHPQHYIDRIRQICQRGGGVLDLGDTSVSANSFEIALLSLGSALTCVEAVLSGQLTRAFSAGRPPGHHAEPDRPMGFCLFSNMAIAARYAQQKHGVSRIAIVDFDVHHGNGTQAAFEDDPSVLFVSLHQHPRTCYPGSGHDYEVGEAAGRGLTMNLPMQPGADDDDYLQAIDERVVPKLDEFRPELLMISAGFDAHRDDPL